MPRDSSAIHRHADRGAPQRILVSRGATLEGFIRETTDTAGMSLRDLDPLTALVVHTRNSQYRIIVSRGTEVIVQGGSFFPDPTPACVDGSSLGSSLLKLGWIGVGLRMEIRTAGQRVVTSVVRSIALEEPDVTSRRPH
jgi:hypothetical protein